MKTLILNETFHGKYYPWKVFYYFNTLDKKSQKQYNTSTISYIGGAT